MFIPYSESRPLIQDSAKVSHSFWDHKNYDSLTSYIKTWKLTEDEILAKVTWNISWFAGRQVKLSIA